MWISYGGKYHCLTPGAYNKPLWIYASTQHAAITFHPISTVIALKHFSCASQTIFLYSQRCPAFPVTTTASAGMEMAL